MADNETALAEFAAARPHDVFALMMFSINQFQVLPFNSQPEMIQAAIHAGGVGSGLSDTDIGSALLAAIARFDDRPVNGNRIILLVSDGGAPITPRSGTGLPVISAASIFWFIMPARAIRPRSQT